MMQYIYFNIPYTDIEECQAEAVRLGALQPQSKKERIAAFFLATGGQYFEHTSVAQQRLAHLTNDCLKRKGYSV